MRVEKPFGQRTGDRGRRDNHCRKPHDREDPIGEAPLCLSKRHGSPAPSQRQETISGERVLLRLEPQRRHAQREERQVQ
jgi:hypothetical protein